MKKDENTECLEFRRKLMVHGVAVGQEDPHCSECKNCAAFIKTLVLTESMSSSVSEPSKELDSTILDHAAKTVQVRRRGRALFLSGRSAQLLAAAAGLVLATVGIWLMLNKRSDKMIVKDQGQEKMVAELSEESNLLDDEIAEVAMAMAAMDSELWGGTETVSMLENDGWDSLGQKFDALDAELYIETVEQTDDAG